MSDLEKCRNFWDWFTENSEQIFNFETDVEHTFALLREAIKKVDENLEFEFGPIENDKREFIISANGIKVAFNAVENLYNQKPNLEKWIILKFRQRKNLASFGTLEFEDTTLSVEDIYFLLFKGNADIGIALFIKDYDAERHINMAFLFLDAALGEYDVETKLGAIEFADFNSEYFSKAKPFSKLPEIFDMVYKKSFVTDFE